MLAIAIANNLSLSEIKQKIKEFQSDFELSSASETPSLKERVDKTFKRFKKAKVEKLLAQLEALMKIE
ncbi:hypothetical protein [Brasilonema sp. UFV-L1]|uniref:hypothetical protein n=1 Tax=Brasilonema sp. UFV-L1 TaxID=2234130 RepID=UPI0030D78608